MSQRPRLFAVGLGLTTCGLLLLEIFATRVLTITVGAYSVYYPIAIAMLGTGAASGIAALVRTPLHTEQDRYRTWLMFSNIAAAISVILFFFLAAALRRHGNISIDAITGKMDAWDFGKMMNDADLVGAVIVGLGLAVPYFFFGFTLAVLFRGSSGAGISGLYAVDLFGAFAGSVLAIAALEWGGYTTPLVATIVLPVLGALCFAATLPKKRALVAGGILLAIAGLLVSSHVRARLEPQPSAALLGNTMWRYPEYRATVVDYRWNSQGRVSAVKLVHPGGDERLVMSYDLGYGQARLWRSDIVLPTAEELKRLPEGGAGEIDNVEAFPNVLIASSKAQDALFIGAGAGAEMIYFDRITHGKSNLTGVELIGDTPGWARDHLGLGEFYDRPNIRMEVAEARSFVAHDRHQYDCIEMPSLAESPSHFMGTAANAFEFTATTEGFESLLRRLRPDGVFALAMHNKIRMVLEFKQLLQQRGLDPSKSIIILGESFPKTWWGLQDRMFLLVKPAGFTKEDVAQLEASLPKKASRILYHPYQDHFSDHAVVTAVIDPNAVDKLQPEARLHGSSILPITDDRPFPDDPLIARDYVSARFWRGQYAGMSKDVERVWQTRRHHILLLGVFILISTLLILGPVIILRRRGAQSGTPVRSQANHLVYFGLLGLGFMLIEMGYIQKFHILIGHSGHTIAIVLASIIVSTGLGSYLSHRTFARGVLNFRRSALATVVLSLAVLLVFELATDALLGLPRPIRYMIAFALPILPAIAMGHLYPQGLAALSAQGAGSFIPLCIAANALLGTLGAGAGPLWAQAFGFRSLIYFGAAAYLIVGLMSHAPRRMPESTPAQ